MDNRPIGLFDSGVGGLTVFKDLYKKLPNESYIYFGDTKNLPYGTKSKQELVELARTIFDFLKAENVKAVVMACNTTSATAYEELKDDYDFEIYPVIQISSKYIANEFSGNIGVLATEATVKSNKYKDELIKNNAQLSVYQNGCKDWVKIVEEALYNDSKSLDVLKCGLAPVLEQNCKNIILGCTHYPYLIDMLKQIVPADTNFINPADFFVQHIVSDLNKKMMTSDNNDIKQQFYVSAEPKEFVEAAKIFYAIDSMPNLAVL